jgi:2-oxo-4-hydroxy-4-carboxy--5-ureidoimidazoline (OHCU) decarboxylase
MPPSLPPVSTLPTLDAEERARVLDTLFEPCQQLHTLSLELLQSQKFGSYDELAAAVGEQLTDLYRSRLESDTKWLDAILSAHPRLGEKKVESEQSRREQAQLNQQGGGGAEEAERLAQMNRTYEETFPGLRYVCVYAFARWSPLKSLPFFHHPPSFQKFLLFAFAIVLSFRPNEDLH